ncbi:PTS galactosamine transporter subunit IIB [uncultured Traorella sp.]|uniref:PTS galactosamine transporter subunit IIB n=1 Tax=uncultured Traorella sp. TaxID=1929048 RepID=UPI0025F5236A|nr:PTS galactosamine transporter subunit IIB [uncultured Traorella sp.]
MPNILLTRIDNRLVHGQVGVTWVSSVGANLLVVADDAVSKDTLQQQLMGITAKSSGIDIRFFSIQKTIDIIHKASSKQKIFLIVRTPQDVVRLLEGNVPITKVNVGNMHFSEGKRKISSKVYVDDHDLEQFKKIKEFGVELYIQDVPDSEKKVL